MVKMELNSVATEGLNLCGDSSRVGDRSFRNLVQITMGILLKKRTEDALKSKLVDYSIPFIFQWWSLSCLFI